MIENEELLVYRGIFSKVHVVLSSLLLFFIAVQFINGGDSFGGVTLGFAILITVLDYGIYFLKGYLSDKFWYTVRIIELIIISDGYLKYLSNLFSIFFALLLLVLVLEFVMCYEFADMYVRVITILVTSCPTIIFLITGMFERSSNQAKFFASLCSVLMILYLVYNISDFIAHVITRTDQKVFELRRLSEHLNLANEALRTQQEKVKRANEELGIQKIKLETAYNKINNVNAETTIQNLIMKYISSSLEITTLLNLITESIFEAIGLDICAVLIQPEIADNEEILYSVRTRLGENSEKLLSQNLSYGSINQYLSVEGTYIDNRVQEGKYDFLCGKKVGSLLVVPLVRDQVVQGALICGKMQYDFFHDNILFFETVVSQLLIAIHNASLYSKMQQMAIKDSLTGIYNRGEMNLLMDQYAKDAREKKTPLSVALLDIDHFKKINDTYGHLCGDVVIKEIAKISQAVATKYHGIAARYGGEEFVLVFPNKSTMECRDIVEKLRLQIAQMEVPWEREIVTAKVSVGLASYPETCTHIPGLLNRADGAMYASKKNGRNQITIDSDEVQEAIRKEKQ